MTATNKGRRITGPEREALSAQVTDGYRGGASIRELAAETGRSYGFIHRLLVESQTTLRGRGGPSKPRAQEQ